MKLKRRKSPQRETIFEIIRNTTSHPTAGMIFDEARKQISAVSLGNVYRNIKILIEEGRISSLDLGDGIEHFDAIVDRHYHFICEICKRIIDFDVPAIGSIEKMAQKKSSHNIKGHVVNFYGICEKCEKKLKRIKEGGKK